MLHEITSAARDDLKHLEGKTDEIGEWFAKAVGIPPSTPLKIISISKGSVLFFEESLGNFYVPLNMLSFKDE